MIIFKHFKKIIFKVLNKLLYMDLKADFEFIIINIF